MKHQIQMAEKHHLGIWAHRLQTQRKIAIFEYDAKNKIFFLYLQSSKVELSVPCRLVEMLFIHPLSQAKVPLPGNTVKTECRRLRTLHMPTVPLWLSLI